MEELSIYNLTITSDHRLKVNNQEVGGDDSTLPGDSESLLAWALVQVGYIQQDSDSNMSLHIEDERPGGYGVQRVTIPPGKRVLIEALRKQTGRDLSYITEEVQRRHAETTSPPEQVAISAQETSATSASPEDDGQWDAPEQAETGSQEPAAPERPQEGLEAEWTQEMPRVEERQQDEAPSLAPPPPLDGVPDVPARPAEPPMLRAPERDYEQTLPEPSRHEQAPLQGGERFPEGWGDFDGPVQPSPARGEEDDAPVLPQFAPEEEVSEHESITSSPVAYKRDRPELGEDEAEKATKKKEKKPRSKVLIGALIVVSLIALFLAVQVVRSQGENSYVATCIDERTMVRQATLEGCKNEEASYYRWWYTPRDSEVPAVNQTVSQSEGTRIRPEEAPIREGFDPAGGVYGGEDEEG